MPKGAKNVLQCFEQSNTDSFKTLFKVLETVIKSGLESAKQKKSVN